MFADAHLHMTDPRFGNGYQGIQGSVLLFSNTSCPEEFPGLLRIAKEDCRVIPFFGTHPWYHDRYERDPLISILENEPEANVGEIGLDSKHGKVDVQIHAFTEQLDIAEEFGRVVSVHMVGTEEHVLRELRRRGLISILHSYSSPPRYAGAFADCGCYFSVSPRLLSRPREKTADILSSIPGDRLLLETDAPDNLGMDMDTFAGKVAEIIGTDAGILMERCLDNARGILKRN